jgi:hypothetical protein
MTEPPEAMPTSANIGNGCAMAAFAAALPVACIGYGMGIVLYPFALVVTSLHAALLGVPLFCLLRPWFKIGWIASGIAGLIVGTTPYLLLAWPDPVLSPSPLYFVAGSGLLGGIAFRWGLGLGKRGYGQ